MNTKRPIGRWKLASVAIAGAAVLGVSTAAIADSTPQAAAAPQPAPAPVNGVPQLVANGTQESPASLGASGRAATAETLCGKGAQWVRPHFGALTLNGTDSITLTGSAGGSVTLKGSHRNGKAFSTRSLQGDCVTITPSLADPASGYQVDSYQFGAAEDVVVAGSGDICGESCSQTADVMSGINPAAVFTSGDNAYDDGSLDDYNSRYEPAWGQFKSITKPSPGNHEYHTPEASGYFDYFNGTGNDTGPAGDRGKGYYSWDVGDWHFVALNSNLDMDPGSEQEQWLREDLAASTKPCTASYWHHPLFTRGSHSNATETKPLWDALYEHKADLNIVGHDHNYQRYAPQTPDGEADPDNGMRQVLVGTGGRAFYDFDRDMPNVEASDASTYGVLKLSLTADGYTGDFLPVEGRTSFADHFTGSCHPKNQ